MIPRQPVAVLGIFGILDVDTVDYKVLAHQRVEVPGRRILKQYSLEINVLAVDELYHHRTDETLYGLGLPLWSWL